jgi:hypothetical protein
MIPKRGAARGVLVRVVRLVACAPLPLPPCMCAFARSGPIIAPWITGSMDRQVHESMDRWTGGSINAQQGANVAAFTLISIVSSDAWVHGSIDAWVDRSMDRWIGEIMGGWMEALFWGLGGVTLAAFGVRLGIWERYVAHLGSFCRPGALLVLLGPSRAQVIQLVQARLTINLLFFQWSLGSKFSQG